MSDWLTWGETVRSPRGGLAKSPLFWLKIRGHSRLRDLPFLHCLGELPGDYLLDRLCLRLIKDSFVLEEIVDTRTQMLFAHRSNFCCGCFVSLGVGHLAASFQQCPRSRYLLLDSQGETARHIVVQCARIRKRRGIIHYADPIDVLLNRNSNVLQGTRTCSFSC